MSLPPLEYWNEANNRLYRKTARVMYKIFQAGVTTGIRQMPASIRNLIDWDVINDAALKFLQQYRLSTVRQITDTTRDKLTRIISDWVQSGDDLPHLIDRIKPWTDEKRAARIAITEVTRTYAFGNKTSWQSTGMVGAMRWNTANDEKVCPYCGPLNGKIVAIDDAFRLPDVKAPLGEQVFESPPAHQWCRCYLTPVVDIEGVRERIRGALDE